MHPGRREFFSLCLSVHAYLHLLRINRLIKHTNYNFVVNFFYFWYLSGQPYNYLLASDIIMNEFFIGIDVQTKRDCCYAISDNNGDLKGSGWFGNDNKNFINLLKKLSRNSKLYVGIDAPRMALPSPRQCYWNGRKDMIDAFVASVTVREFTRGKGIEVGNGDGVGAIILPRPLPEPLLPVLSRP